MTEGWIETTLGALCERGAASLQTGPFGSQLHSSDYVADGVPVVPTEAIGRRRISEREIPQVSLGTFERLARHKLRAGDILFARRGVQATGLSALVEPKHEGWLCGTGGIRLRLETPEIDPTFLSYELSADESNSWIRAHAAGAVMPNVNEEILRRLPLLLPPLPQQRAISAMLSALDDRIDANQRMNRTLEEVASAFFRSWFVDFDPVIAKAAGRAPVGVDATTAELFPSSFEDSDLGPIPRGWNWVPVGDVVDLNPRRDLKTGAVASYVDMAALPTRGHSCARWERRPAGSGMRFKNGDTLLARITPCLENGKSAFVDFLDRDEIAWGSTEYIVLSPRPPLPPVYAYLLIRDSAFREDAAQGMTGSSGRQRVNAEHVGRYIVAKAQPRVAEAFGRIVTPLFELARCNAAESRTLAALRDTLLPKLLSGGIRLRDAEHAVEAVL